MDTPRGFVDAAERRTVDWVPRNNRTCDFTGGWFAVLMLKRTGAEIVHA
jgi:hypothetical protein